jgi:phosphotransferase system IIB component
LGGRDNVAQVEVGAGRLLFRARRREVIDVGALRELGARGVAHTGLDSIQVLLPQVEAWALRLRQIL